MPLSSVVGAQSIIKPGVCTSSTRPAVPFEGQMIYETDTDKVLVYNGSAWYANWNLPWGLVSVTSATAATGTFTTQVTTITAPSFTAIANRYYRISYYEPVLQYISGTVNVIEMTMKIGGVAFVFSEVKISSATDNSGILTTTRTLTAGATVITGHLLATGGGTGNGYRAATAIAQIVIEDIGPA